MSCLDYNRFIALWRVTLSSFDGRQVFCVTFQHKFKTPTRILYQFQCPCVIRRSIADVTSPNPTESIISVCFVVVLVAASATGWQFFHTIPTECVRVCVCVSNCV